MAQQELRINIKGDASGLNSALNTASGKLKAFGGKLQSIGGSLTKTLTLPLIAAGGAATKMAFDFDKSLTQIKSLVGVAGDEVDAMGERAKQMALDTGKSAAEAADALFFITSAGLRGDQAMQTLEASLKAAAVGLGETKTIADLATSAMNAYGTGNLSASQATDILTTAVREGKLEASQLAGSMGGVIPIASNLGVGFDEVAAALAAMSRTGTDAANGATQLNAILSSIAKPTEKSVQAFAKMGLTTDDLQKSLAEDGLMNTLVMLKNRLAATGQEFTDIAPNVRAWKGVLDLTGAGMQDNIKIFESLENHLGATDKAFQTTAESSSFQLTQSLEQMKAPLMEVGAVLLQMIVPVVQQLSGFLKGLADRFRSLDKDTQEFIIKIAGIAAAAGPVLIAVGKMVSIAGQLGPVLTVAANGFRILTAAMMANPILAVVAGFVALGTAIYKYSKAQKDAVKNATEIADIEELLAEKRAKLLEETDTLSNNGNRNRQIHARKNIADLQEEIKILEQKQRKIKEDEAKAQAELKIDVPEVVLPELDLPSYEVDFEAVVNPEDAQAAADKLKQLNDEINKALVTNDQKAYEQRKKDSQDYYNELIKQAGQNAEQVKALTLAKAQALAQIELDENARILEIKNQIAAATTQTEAERKALEIANVQSHYAELIRLATENGLETQGLMLAQAQEEQKIRDSQSAAMQEKLLQLQETAKLIGGEVTNAFSGMAMGLVDSLGLAENGMEGFLGGLLKTVLQAMSMYMGQAIAAAIAGSNAAAAATGAAAIFTQPTFMATMVGGVLSAFASIPKFANGGIVSAPTMGLMGEYPGAKSNPEVIAPLDKLKGLMGTANQTANVQVGGEVKLRGSDLIVAIDRANKNRNRLI
jgi:TP901 family phage tail tape measure protein